MRFLTGQIKRKWDKWVQDLAETKEIRINRCLYDTGGGDVTECYLHGFGNASKKAYCAMVYFVYFIRWSFGAKGKEYKHLPNATAIQKFRQEESLLEMRP